MASPGSKGNCWVRTTQHPWPGAEGRDTLTNKPAGRETRIKGGHRFVKHRPPRLRDWWVAPLRWISIVRTMRGHHQRTCFGYHIHQSLYDGHRAATDPAEFTERRMHLQRHTCLDTQCAQVVRQTFTCTWRGCFLDQALFGHMGFFPLSIRQFPLSSLLWPRCAVNFSDIFHK